VAGDVGPADVFDAQLACLAGVERSVGLDEFADPYPKDLSGGMKQPFGALDPQTRWGMQSVLLDVSRSQDNTILLVTHDVSEAVYLADTIYVMAPLSASTSPSSPTEISP
jgi:ABC-type nitrate/sulfonate/bicarbonate transport system ATPase subunit